jgi:uncharacterized RDD family membrane protein YckC
MRQWYYYQNKKQNGPLNADKFVLLFQDGELSSETYVWTKGLTKWIKAKEIDSLRKYIYEIELPPIPIENIVENTKNNITIRPWVRLYARGFDNYLFSILSYLFFKLFLISEITMDNLLQNILFIIFIDYLLSIFIFEPFFLSIVGNTPGKLLLNINISTLSGKKLSWKEASLRCIEVYTKGFWLGIPILSLIPMQIQYDKLLKTGTTDWDKDKYMIRHKKIGILRWIGYFIIASFLKVLFDTI